MKKIIFSFTLLLSIAYAQAMVHPGGQILSDKEFAEKYPKQTSLVKVTVMKSPEPSNAIDGDTAKKTSSLDSSTDSNKAVKETKKIKKEKSHKHHICTALIEIPEQSSLQKNQQFLAAVAKQVNTQWSADNKKIEHWCPTDDAIHQIQKVVAQVSPTLQKATLIHDVMTTLDKEAEEYSKKAKSILDDKKLPGPNGNDLDANKWIEAGIETRTEYDTLTGNFNELKKIVQKSIATNLAVQFGLLAIIDLKQQALDKQLPTLKK
jgi:endonuclease YncB( thermonuclease family)